MSEPKYAHRFPPCPVYDLECMESWLEDLAKQGLILTKAGLFFGFAEFEKTTPKPMRYRMQPLPKKKFLENRRPADAVLEFAGEYGWAYLCNLGDYAVFSCDNPDARELDTDPHIQRLGLEQLHRRKRNSLIALGLLYALCLVLIFWGDPIVDLLNSNIWKLVCRTCILILGPILCINEFQQLQSIRKKLALGEPLSRTVNWKKRRWQHACLTVCLVSLFASYLLSDMFGRYYQWPHSAWQPLDTDTQEIPFATMTDLAGGGVFEADGYYVEEDNHIAERSTLLAPRQIKLQQLGNVIHEDTVVLDGILEVEYYELRTDWLAKELFREIRQNDARSKRYHPLSLTELPTEQEIAYTNLFPTLLLQDGNKVLRVEFTQFEDGVPLDLDIWATRMVSCFMR